MFFVKYLFNSISSEDSNQYRNAAISRYGRLNVQRAEGFANKLSKEFLSKVKLNHDKIIQELFSIKQLTEDSIPVQELIENHFNCVNQYWGTISTIKQHLESYRDLAQSYLNHPVFSTIKEETQPEFAKFMHQAMNTYVKKQLKVP